MKKTPWMSAAMMLSIVLPAYALFGRDNIDSLWPSGPVSIDGRAIEWSDMPILDENGIGFHAMNDAANLYLLIGGTAGDGRLLLSGKSEQNITLWFIKPDGKTKDWGINLDFSHAPEPSMESPTRLSDWGMAPARVVQQGMEVSTTAFPPEIEFVADLSSQRGRQPIYEMRIPLSMIAHKGRTIDLDFVTTDITYERRAELLSLPPPAPRRQTPENGEGSGGSNGSGGMGGGGGHHHHGGGASSGGGAESAADLPKRLNLHLVVRLAKEPKR